MGVACADKRNMGHLSFHMIHDITESLYMVLNLDHLTVIQHSFLSSALFCNDCSAIVVAMLHLGVSLDNLQAFC